MELYRDKLPKTHMLLNDDLADLHPSTDLDLLKGCWFPVLDKGYIRIKDWFGSDLEVANDATVSFMKEAIQFDTPQAKIVKFLGDNDHSSPFRHQMVKLEVYAPLMVARQWWKYVVGSDHVMDAWNEASRRYVTLEPEFYIPQWRSAPANKKQGSEGPLDSHILARELDRRFQFQISRGLEYYQSALDQGVAPEQARCFLPAYAMYTPWIWTASLQSLCHFIGQRGDSHAQWEIQQYANPLEQVARTLFPTAAPSLLENHPIRLRSQLGFLQKQYKDNSETIVQLEAEVKRLSAFEPPSLQ